MFLIDVQKNCLSVKRGEVITSGSVRAYSVQFNFSPEWAGMTRVAVFKSVGSPVCILLDEANLCDIPWEVLKDFGAPLLAGVYGKQGEEVVLPTRWASLGRVQEGVILGENSRPPVPDLWEQLLDRRGNRLAYTPDGRLGLYSGDRLLDSVVISSGSGGAPLDYVFGHGFTMTGSVVSIHTTDDFAGDNTLPMTAAGVEATVGNIAALLETI